MMKLLEKQKVNFCMQSGFMQDSVADPLPSKMGHKKGVTLTSFMSVKTRSCMSHCI